MADKRISQLVERTDIANNDVLPIVASGATTTNKVTVSTLQEWMQDNLDVGVTSVGITLGTTGTDVNVTGSPITTSGNITINIPDASATARGVVSTGTQTFAGNKTLVRNINVNGVYVGRGASGGDLFSGIAGNTSVGSSALISITTGFPNTALGSEALRNITTGANNIAIGSEAGKLDAGSGAANATSSSSIYIGNSTKPQSNGNTNEIVIGHASSGNGSNTTTIGNSSTTFNRFFGATLSDSFRLPSDGGGNQVTVFENIGTIHTGSAGSNIFGFNNSNNIFFGKGLSNGGVIQWTNAAVRYYTLPDADGTIALTSDLTGYVTLGTVQTITGQKTFNSTIVGQDATLTSSGSNRTLLVTHSSGSGIAVDISKGGNGEGLRVTKTSGSGNAVTISGGLLSAEAVTLTGALNGTSANFTGNLASDTSVIAGQAFRSLHSGSVSTINGYNSIQGDANGFIVANTTKGFRINFPSNSSFTQTLPDASGTIALTSNLSAYLPLAGGTLTGALNGTSASFTGNVQGDFFTVGTTAATSGGIRLGTQVAIRARNVANTNNIPLIESTSSDNVSIASGGASVGIGGTNTDSLFTINGTAGTSHQRFREGSTTVGLIGGANGIITGHNGKLAVRGESGLVLSGQGNSADMIISSTGAATFASSVNVGGTSANTDFRVYRTVDAGAYFFITAPGGDPLTSILGVSGTDVMSLRANGNVGIGTASPNTKLQVEDGFISTYHPVNLNSAGYGIQFFTNGGGSKNTIASIDISQVGTARSGDIIFSTSNSGGPTERMRITSGGNVGIGTTSITNSISGTERILEIANSNVASLYLNSTVGKKYGIYSSASGSLVTYDITSSAARLILDTNGNFGLGYTSPNKFGVLEESTKPIRNYLGNANAQGRAQNYKIVRHIPVTSIGNVLTIPFTSQGNLNSNTIARISGHSARFNNWVPLGFVVEVAVGHLTSLGALQVMSMLGNASAVSISGMNLQISFGSTYQGSVSDGLYLTIEYMTNEVSYSIFVPGIALN
jgi:hypothetical protein